MDGMGTGRDWMAWHEGVGVEATTHKGAGIWKGWDEEWYGMGWGLGAKEAGWCWGK